MPLTLYLVRHGSTAAPPGTFVGSTDLELSAAGRQESLRLASSLPRNAECLCSPMRRCQQTLDLIQQQGAALSPRFDARLKEMDFGDWEMQTLASVDAKPDQIRALSRYHGFCFPGGESVAEFGHRLRDVAAELRKLAARADGERVMISHGGVIRSLVCLFLGLDIRHYLLFRVDPGSITTIRLYKEGGVLTGLNQRPGLSGVSS